MPEALHRSALDALGMEITAGTQPEGAVLTLERIQQRFAVSRTVARECMRLLEQLQLVTSSRRVGIVVRPSGDRDVLDAWVIRRRATRPWPSVRSSARSRPGYGRPVRRAIATSAWRSTSSSTR